MAQVRLSIAAAAVLVLTGTAGAAHAQSAQPNFSNRDAAARDAFQLNESQNPQVLELEGKSRFGIKLELQQPVTREREISDVEVGVTYRLTPSIRLGGAVGVTESQPPEAAEADGEKAPRIRLGTSFKF
jgi:hypothetical protein